MKLKFFLSLGCVAILLTSCSVRKFIAFSDYIIDSDNYEKIECDNYNKPSAYSESFTEIYRNFPHDRDKKINLPSTGERKLLVIPVEFTDSTCENAYNGCSITKEQIKNVFFGSSKNSLGESVASFYNKSSFGKLKITGEVTDWFNPTMNKKDIMSDDENNAKLNSLVSESIYWYRTKNTNIDDYDTDHDGFIDAVALVYSTESTLNTPFWAFASSTNATSDITVPKGKNFMWIGSDFLHAYSARSKVDARTFIHETGHLLGLNDYYSTNSKQNYQPLGKLDAMDLGLGDHNVFSKMLLNWTRPFVATGSTTIKLKPSQKNGDCILISNHWNGSAMDEYLLLELYTPTGLNELDAKNQYTDGQIKVSLMDNPGIKIFHVDARVAYYKTFPQDFIDYVDTIDPSLLQYYDATGQLYYKRIAHSNTLINSRDDNTLIHLLESSGQNTFLEGGIVNDSSLFHAGDTLKNFIFNSGETSNYDIEIKSLSAEEATVKVSFKGA